MEIQTFSIVVGTRACNARCPFCVSRMTGFGELPTARIINERNFRKACLLAERAGTTTVLMTGKGEPTLYPDEVSAYLRLLDERSFPLIEIQTNALEIGRLARDGACKSALTRAHLEEWYANGLSTIAVSTVGIRTEANQAVYAEDYPDLGATLDYIHELGFSVRLCVMMQRTVVDSPESLQETIDFCRERQVEQLTVRSIRRPKRTESDAAGSYVDRYGLTEAQAMDIETWLDRSGTLLMTLMHGAKIYDVDGQNVCLADCLTIRPKDDDIRTLIFYGDGRLTYDWQHEGAILLGGNVPRGRKLETA